MSDVVLHEDEIDGLPVAWRSAPSEGAPILWLHGVPESSACWAPFLVRAGGIAVDLPGFGRSGKPASFDYSIGGYTAFLERFLDHVGVDRIRLAMHDWGGVGLAFAQRFPARVERLVAMDVVPLLPGYRWHRVARLWRTPIVGELMMGFTVRSTLRLAMRRSVPDAWIDEVLEHFDHGTQRAILRLYRASDPDVLAAAGSKLADVRAPALIVWGERDSYLPARLADALAAALPAASTLHVPGAGHWPWHGRPDVVERVAAFLDESS